jgi:hypothetical protein
VLLYSPTQRLGVFESGHVQALSDLEIMIFFALQTFKPVRGERSVLVTEEDILQEASEIEREKYLLRDPALRRHVCEMQAEKLEGLG